MNPTNSDFGNPFRNVTQVPGQDQTTTLKSDENETTRKLRKVEYIIGDTDSPNEHRGNKRTLNAIYPLNSSTSSDSLSEFIPVKKTNPAEPPSSLEQKSLADSSFYKGELKDGKRHGYGTYKYANGDLYEGEWEDNKWHGSGTYKFANGEVYQGEFKDGKRHGNGTYKSADGTTYVGGYKAGARHGNGILKNRSGHIIHNGEWKKDNPHRKRSCSYSDGIVYEGDFKDDVPHGHGICKYPTGELYIGKFNNGKRSGYGICLYANDSIYRGQWKDNQEKSRNGINIFVPTFKPGIDVNHNPTVLDFLKDKPELYKYLDPRLRFNPSFCLEALKQDPRLYDYIDEEIKSNQKFLYEIMNINKDFLIDLVGYYDDDFFIDLLKADRGLFNFFDINLRYKKEFILKALKINPMIFFFDIGQLNKDQQVIESALSELVNELSNYKHISSELYDLHRRDPHFAGEVEKLLHAKKELVTFVCRDQKKVTEYKEILLVSDYYKGVFTTGSSFKPLDLMLKDHPFDVVHLFLELLAGENIEASPDQLIHLFVLMDYAFLPNHKSKIETQLLHFFQRNPISLIHSWLNKDPIVCHPLVEPFLAECFINLHVNFQNSIDNWGGVLKQECVDLFNHFKNRADRGDFFALSFVGYCYQYGIGVPAHKETALSIYEKTAQQGNSWGKYFLANSLREDGSQKDLKNSIRTELINRSIKLYEELHDESFSLASLELGDFYKGDHGYDVPRNFEKAFHYYESAASAKSVKGLNKLGLCHEFSVGVYRRPKFALKCYTQSAERGFADALYNLGRCYKLGIGVEADPNLAFEYYKKSADLGCVDGIAGVGECYLKGIGIQKNNEQAFLNISQAASQNHIDAICMLACCYEYGIGVPVDKDRAMKLYKERALDRKQSKNKYF